MATSNDQSHALILAMRNAREIERIGIANNFETLLHLTKMIVMEIAILDGTLLHPIPEDSDVFDK